MNKTDNTALHHRPPPLNGSQPEAEAGEAVISNALENNNVHRPPPLNRVQPEAAAAAEISNGASENIVHGSRIWIWCPRCNTALPHPASFLRRLPLWCSICTNFNPLWGSSFTNEDPNYGRNSTNDDSDHQEWRADRENVEFPDNTVGLLDDDSDNEQLLEDCENVQLSEEIIFTYLLTRDHRNFVKKEEECEICVVCQNEFIEEEIFIRLDCRHDYHYQCIHEWLIHKNSCPLCVCIVIPSNFEIFKMNN